MCWGCVEGVRARSQFSRVWVLGCSLLGVLHTQRERVAKVRQRQMEVAAKVARDAERAIRLAQELKSREALALQLRHELDQIEHRRRRQEESELLRMQDEEHQQRSYGDAFWGMDIFLRNVAKGERCVHKPPPCQARRSTS